jgi:hypothetical protein
MAEFKTLQFPNNADGQTAKIAALTAHANLGWRVVSETITQGHIKGEEAAASACAGMLCCGPFGATAGLTAGRTDGTINVTLQRD